MNVDVQWLLVGFMLPIPAVLGFATLWWMERKARIQEQKLNKSASRDLGRAVAALERTASSPEPVKLNKMFEDALSAMKQEYRR